jgi:hypothetical protein
MQFMELIYVHETVRWWESELINWYLYWIREGDIFCLFTNMLDFKMLEIYIFTYFSQFLNR